MLEVCQVSKTFAGGVQALDDVSLEVGEGEVVGLVGENGAGKSTLMRILSGVHAPDRGTLRLHGRPVVLRGPRDANAHGIGMVFQEQSLLPNLSVAANIYLGQEREFLRGGLLLDHRRLHAAARRQLEKVQVALDPRVRTSELSFAARQMVELAKVLTLEERTHQPLVILLDEPTSVLEKHDVDVLFARVRALRRRASFVFVSHRLDEVLAVSDRVYVLKDGRVVAQMPAAATSAPELHRLMVGRERQTEYYRESQQRPGGEEIILQARGLSVAGAYADVHFTLRRGEVLGIVGVVGSGREELTRTLFGFLPPTGGTLEVRGRPVHLRSPARAAALGIGYVPRERRVEGLVGPLSVAVNITLARLSTVLRGGGLVLALRREREIAGRWRQRLRIRAPNVDTRCQNLSGGNQQKVVLSKWLNARADILILDHPTRGLDVGAKEEVYELVRTLCAEGIAVVLTSDTLEEATGLSHALLVMRDGAVTARFDAPPGGKPTQLQLIEHMV